MLGRQRTQDAADQCGVEGGGGGFATDVSNGQGDAAGAVVEEIVYVAADGAGGEELGCDLGAFELRRAGGHEA